jgi:hypothetical protein
MAAAPSKDKLAGVSPSQFIYTGGQMVLLLVRDSRDRAPGRQ